MPDDYGDLRQLGRTRIGLIWQLAQAGVDLEDGDRRLAEVLRQHPEYHHVWEDVESLAGEISTLDGVNPFAHVLMHHVVENQLADDDPPQTTRALEALLKVGTDRHDAVHAIAAVVAEELNDMVRVERVFDRDGYVDALEDLARTARQCRRRGRRAGKGGRTGRR